MASTESGRQMYPSFKEAHEAFVAEYTAPVSYTHLTLPTN